MLTALQQRTLDLLYAHRNDSNVYLTSPYGGVIRCAGNGYHVRERTGRALHDHLKPVKVGTGNESRRVWVHKASPLPDDDLFRQQQAKAQENERAAKLKQSKEEYTGSAVSLYLAQLLFSQHWDDVVEFAREIDTGLSNFQNFCKDSIRIPMDSLNVNCECEFLTDRKEET